MQAAGIPEDRKLRLARLGDPFKSFPVVRFVQNQTGDTEQNFQMLHLDRGRGQLPEIGVDQGDDPSRHHERQYHYLGTARRRNDGMEVVFQYRI